MPSGRETLRNALLDFTASLSQGAAAQAQFPGARGNRAGMAAAIAAPAMLRSQRAAQAQEAEDRRMKMIQFTDMLRQGRQKEALELLNAVDGRPGPEFTSALQTQQAAIPESLDGTMGPQPAPETIGQHTVSLPMPEIHVPGFGMVRPRSAQDLRRQALEKYQQEQQIATNEKIRLENATYRPPVDQTPNVVDIPAIPGILPNGMKGVPSAVAPSIISALTPSKATPGERNQQFRDIQRGGKDVRQYFDGSDPSKVTFEVELGTIKDKSDDPLTSYQRNQTFMAISNKYQADAIINQSIKGQTAKSIADQIIADPGRATNQLSALYLFVKNLDPESAVREGEMALANQTQSYFQKWGNSLSRISEGRVLSPEAAKELAKATKDLVSAWEATAKTRTSQYKSQAATAGVGSQFDQYLSGFTSIQGTGAPSGAGSENRTRIKF